MAHDKGPVRSGGIWNKEKQTCTMPKISTIKLTLGREPACDGGRERRHEEEASLKKSRIWALMKAREAQEVEIAAETR